MRAARIVWIAILVLAAIGLLWNAAVRPSGMAKEYVRDTKKSFVEVEVAPPIGADGNETTATKWLPTDSEELARPNVRPVAGANEISWVETTPIPPREAWSAMAAGDPDVRLSLARTIGVWIAALGTLAIFSFLWRDNPVYRVFESIIVGVSAAFWMVVGFWSTLVPNLFAPLAPDLVRAWALPAISSDATIDWTALVPLTFGVMLLWRLAPKGGWISIWPLAFIFGTTAGLKLVSYTQADLLGQVSNSIVPLWVHSPDGGFEFGSSLGNLVLIVGILTVLTYFFFSIEHKGVPGKAARVGIWFLMITFGSMFGFTVMGRITLLAQRFEFLFGDWLWIVDPNRSREVASSVTTLVGAVFGVG